MYNMGQMSDKLCTIDSMRMNFLRIYSDKGEPWIQYTDIYSNYKTPEALYLQ